jgi:hypothetical protein
MYNVKIETIRETSRTRIAARDLDHAMRIADTRKCDPDVSRVAIYREHKLISVVFEASTQYQVWG